MSAANILVVEDEILVAEEIALRARQLGYGVCGIADNAADAFELATKLHPDMALVDIQIKGPLTGIDVARRFRDEMNIPVVFLTAHADAITLKDATATEPFGYLIKPFEPRALVATLETALRRSRAEAQVAKMERWLAATMNSIGDGVIATDEAFRVSFINPVGERLTGWLNREALGRPGSDVFSITMQSGATLADLLEEVTRTGLVVTLDEGVLMTRDGRSLPVDDTIAPIRDSQGRLTGVVIVFRDASARIEYERSLRELNATLEEGIKLRTAQLEAANTELAAFAYSIAHDLRAPLRAVGSFAARVVENYASHLDSEGQRLLSVVTARAGQMSKMIDDYLRLSGLSRCGLRLERLDMTALARQSWQDVTTGTATPPTLYLSELPAVRGDAGLIGQVWSNLLSNAVKFTRAVRDPQVHVSATADDKFVYYSIRDNGAGFDPTHADKLFHLFSRLHSTDQYEGNGIGLCVVQRIMHRHEGDVRMEGAPGQGATVTFWLPR